jgi:chemotaxis protein histidine kinase CheA
MAQSTPWLLDRQINRVRRRLFLQQLVVYLAWSWLGAFAVATAWFLLQPLLLQEAPAWLRWTVLGAGMGLATLASVLLAVFKAPSTLTAALSLDERFQLRERVTTSLTLDATMAQSPAGQALFADVQRRLDPVRVGDRFPVKVPMTAWFVPAGAAAIAVITLFYNPTISPVVAGTEGEKLNVSAETKSEMQKKLDKLKKPEPKPNDPRVKSEELARIEAELDKMAKKPPETKEEANELLTKMTEIEDKIKQAQKEHNDKDEARREAMKQIDKLMNKKDNEGPGNDLRKALDKNDLKKAEDELDKLSQKLQNEDKAEKLKKKLEDENLSKEERDKTQKELDKLKDQGLTKEQKDKLQDQIGDMKEKLERLARKQEEEKQELKDKAEKGEIDPETLKKELDKLEKGKLSDKDLQDLKNLADKLGEVQQAMKDGKDGDAGKKMEELADELDRLDKEADGEGKALKKKLQELQEAKKSVCEGTGDCESDKDMAKGGGRATGRRPLGPDDTTGSEVKRERSQMDVKGVRVVDHVPGQGMKSPKSQEELREDIKKASQDAPEAIDRMRLPKSAGDMTRGYFDRLRGSDKAPADQPK